MKRPYKISGLPDLGRNEGKIDGDILKSHFMNNRPHSYFFG